MVMILGSIGGVRLVSFEQLVEGLAVIACSAPIGRFFDQRSRALGKLILRLKSHNLSYGYRSLCGQYELSIRIDAFWRKSRIIGRNLDALNPAWISYNGMYR